MIDPHDPRVKIDTWVIYKRPEMERGQDGRISSLQAAPRMIHVRFGMGGGQACPPEDLHWPLDSCPPTNDR